MRAARSKTSSGMEKRNGTSLWEGRLGALQGEFLNSERKTDLSERGAVPNFESGQRLFSFSSVLKDCECFGKLDPRRGMI